MKFIITENQKILIQQKIYNFVEDLIPDDFYLMYYKNGEDVSKPKKISDIDSFELIDDIYVVFRVYLPNYWTLSARNKIENSPMLEMSLKKEELLNSLFGDRWHESIKDWVKHNLNDVLPEPIEIKSISNR